MRGDAIPVNEQVLINTAAGIADFSVSASGALVYQAEGGVTNQFVWVDREGRELSTVGPRGKYRAPALSPDGNRVAYEDVARGDIWVLDLDRQTPSRFTSGAGFERCPVWFPDGTKIAYRNDYERPLRKGFQRNLGRTAAVLTCS